jgi:hypothetical protein
VLVLALIPGEEVTSVATGATSRSPFSAIVASARSAAELWQKRLATKINGTTTRSIRWREPGWLWPGAKRAFT